MKKHLKYLAVDIFLITIACLLLVFTFSCKKKQTEPAETGTISYASMQDFYNQNGVPKQTFTINAVNGGTFVSAKGTTVNIPANAFKDSAGNLISGIINFEFKDIYKKSDMVLSDKATNCDIGAMKSAGEFYLNGTYKNILFASTKTITVTQPSNQPYDANMEALIIIRSDTAQFVMWNAPCGSFTCGASIAYYAPNYLYYIHSGTFSSGPITPRWFNTDNPYAFSAYSQTTLSIINPDASFETDVFIIFKTINSVLQIYNSNGYSYSYAPIGLQATIVAAGIKDGKLQTSIIPITISPNQSVTLNYKYMSTDDFVTALKALD